MAVGLLLVVALTALYVAVLYWADRHEKEPSSVLGAALLGGAIAAPVLSMVLERLADIRMSVYPAAFHALNAAFFGPNPAGAVIEEGTKALVILGLFRLLPREFDGTLDGVVYGGVVGAGFALAESAVYLWDLARVGAGGLGLGAMFGILVTGLTHSAFGALFGASLGAVREFGLTGSAAWWLPVGGFALAGLYHAAYDALAAIAGAGTGPGALVVVARQLADWAGVIALGVIVIWALGHERNVIARYLPVEAQEGHIPREYAEAAANRRWADVPRAARQPLAELAFARRRLERGLASEAELEVYRNRIREVAR
ncbi:MAG: PrsW family glutamic-type intramembrane protease [Armatimonadota bacterium]|nr:PrsW family intramembrane metalloprotease [Armatimonadota bacterium]MDW8155381.1 PrsW family glutamic-type intramembrane protease [Armatimonadota bacterium]